MSARVLNPVILTEFCRMRSPVRAQMPNRAALAKIKRDLFGPVDKDDSKRFVETELTKHHQTASDRWGFNFVHGYPVADHKQFMWERVPPTSGIPQMYTLSRAAHTRPITPKSVRLDCAASVCHHQPTLDELLDERAERANRPSSPLQVDHSTSSSSTSDESDTSLSPQKAHISLTITAAASPIMRTRQQQQLLQSTPQPSAVSSPTSFTLRSSPREKRQPRITDYLKERKRLAPTPKKVSPSKRTRLNTSASRVA